jgi:hypothetical protein
LALYGCWLVGCVLPSFERVGTGEAPLAGATCGLSERLPRACDGCIRERCCDLAAACGEGTECGADLLEPITPVAEFSAEFEPLLSCLQAECATECRVHWGCLDHYSWPAEEPTDQEVKVIEFLSAKPIPDVDIKACNASDPTVSCRTGRAAEAVTDENGVAVLAQLPPTFDGVYRFAGSEYLPATARFTEPVHQVRGFQQFLLSDVDLAAFAITTGVHKTFDEAFEPDRGHMIVRVQNCLPVTYVDTPLRATAPNVRIEFPETEGASQFFYTEESGEVSVSREYTSIFGFGGAFNFPPYNIAVRAVDVDTEQEVASGRAQIVAGGIAFLYLLPRSAVRP